MNHLEVQDGSFWLFAPVKALSTNGSFNLMLGFCAGFVTLPLYTGDRVKHP